MSLVRIQEATPLEGFRLRLKLTDGSVIERDVLAFLTGPVFEPLRVSPAMFKQVKAENGTVVWPNGADLCPDVLIEGGAPSEKPTSLSKGLAGQKSS